MNVRKVTIINKYEQQSRKNYSRANESKRVKDRKHILSRYIHLIIVACADGTMFWFLLFSV